VILASQRLRDVAVAAADGAVAPGIRLRVAPVGFVRLGPCPFDVEPASYNRTCPRAAPWWCPTGVAAKGPGGPSHRRWGPLDAPYCILYGESLMKYSTARLNDSTAYG
jgi:hypothetical protein